MLPSSFVRSRTQSTGHINELDSVPDDTIRSYGINSAFVLEFFERGAAMMTLISPASRRAQLYLTTILAMVLSGVCLATPTASCTTTVLSSQQVRAAIDDITTHLASASYGSARGLPPDIATRLAFLRRTAPSRTPAWQFAFNVNVALAKADDGHLGLHLIRDAETHCPTLPVALAWSDRGLFVRSGGAVSKGARIISIGGKSLRELQQLALMAVPHENVYWARSELARLLPRADAALGYGLTAKDGTVTVTFMRLDGTVGSERIAPATPLTPPSDWISYRLFPDRSTALLRLSRLDDNDEAADKLAAFIAEVIHERIRKVVVDLRGNPGGDASLAVAILRYLGHTQYESFSVDIRLSPELHAEQPRFDPENISSAFVAAGLKPPLIGARGYSVPGPLVLAATTQSLPSAPNEVAAGRQLYLLVDGGTFSSAALFALLVRDNRLGVLIGEPIGTSTSFHGGELDLPIRNIDYYLSVSSTRLERPDPAAGESPTILPDILVPLTGTSLAEGKDEALEYVLRAESI
jgi:hypothetical protein